MLYYKQAVADTVKQIKHNYGSTAYEIWKKRQKSLKKLLTNRKQHVKLYKLSLERVTEKKEHW